MKKYGVWYVLSMACLVGIGGLSLWWWAPWHGRPPVVAFVMTELATEQRAYEGFQRKMAQEDAGLDWDIRQFFYVPYDHESLQVAIRRAAACGPKILVSMGYFAPPRVAGALSQTPLVFIGLDDCKERGLVDSLEAPGGLVTGVVAAAYDELVMAYLLQTIKPGARLVLIPYDQEDDVGGMVVAAAERMRGLLARYGIQALLLPLPCMHEALPLIAQQSVGVDVILTVEIDPLEALMPQLVTLCEQRKITLFAGTVEGASVGAVLSFGGHQQVLGKAAFGLVRAILEQQASAGALPVAQVTGHRQCIFDSRRATGQGLSRPDEAALRLRLLRFGQSAPYAINFKVL